MSSDTITGLWLLHSFSVCRPFRKLCPRFESGGHCIKESEVQSYITLLVCLCATQAAEDTWVKQKMPKKTNRWWFWRKNSVQQVFTYIRANSPL